MGAFELDEDAYIRPPNWGSSDAISLADRVLRVVDVPGVQTIDIGMKYSWGPNDPTFPPAVRRPRVLRGPGAAAL